MPKRFQSWTYFLFKYFLKLRPNIGVIGAVSLKREKEAKILKTIGLTQRILRAIFVYFCGKFIATIPDTRKLQLGESINVRIFIAVDTFCNSFVQ